MNYWSTDGQELPLKILLFFAATADILVHDCQYVPEEMDIKRGWGHSDVDSVDKTCSGS